MVKKLPLLFLFSLLALAGIAQPASLNCGTSGRYISNIFSSTTRDTNIIYGYARDTNYVGIPNTTRALKLNFHQPVGDPAVKRPLIILAFGGAFVAGDRFTMDTLCAAFARKGYVAATIDYRLINSNTFNILVVYSNPAYLADAVVKACSDMKAAVRFFKRDASAANLYKVDSTKIFVGGYSAGAITALQTAYVDPEEVIANPLLAAAYGNNGGYEGNTDLPSPNNGLPGHNARGLAGVFNIAGGVADTNLIDVINPPVYSSQGNMDQTVPYDSGFVSFNGVATSSYLYGTHTIQRRANTVGLSNQLYTINNGNHQSPVAVDSTYLITSINGAAAFFQPIVCATTLPVTLAAFSVENSNCAAALKWQTASENRSSRYEVEVSADSRKFMQIGIVQSKNAASGASYSYNYKSFDGTSYYRLKMVDADGRYTYSPVQKLSLPCNLTTIQVYPNPAKDQTLITGLKQGMQVQLLNAQGQKLWSQKVSNSALQVPLAAFTSGLYLVQVADESGKIISNTKLMKE